MEKKTLRLDKEDRLSLSFIVDLFKARVKYQIHATYKNIE